VSLGPETTPFGSGTSNEPEWAKFPGTAEAAEFHFTGSRNQVRQQAARKALEQIIIRLNKDT